ncbi:hypothetical protein L537_3445 [Bordetella hinzii 1277]|nr:hypothetical protein L537_3445 [Bordetella hinzii 1277]
MRERIALCELAMKRRHLILAFRHKVPVEQIHFAGKYFFTLCQHALNAGLSVGPNSLCLPLVRK